MHKVKSQPSTKYDFDLIVIGSGAGGGVAAHLAARDGKKVGLIESNILGGDCTINGCMTTEALLKTAKTLEVIKDAPRFGIKPINVSFNYRAVQARKERTLVAAGLHSEASSFKSNGITVIKGQAHFLNPWVISAGLRRYSAKKFLISTGGSLVVPDIPGLKETGFITYKEAGHLLKLPRSIFIIGGGATAYEYAQIFGIFGCRVHVAEVKDHILPKEDPEVSDSAEAALSAKVVTVYTNAKVSQASGGPGRKVITFNWRGQQRRVAVEEIMVAAGQLPNVDLGLENAGVQYSVDGIHVNHLMQTSQKNIFTAGDVIGTNISVTHAIKEGRVAIHNMFTKHKIRMDYHAVPRCYSGMPEIAIVGKTERELLITGEPFQTAITPVGILGKAITNDYSAGFVKIIATHSGILLGASIVAPQASEMLQELTFAIQHHNYACAIANTEHIFPTWSEAIRIAASKIKCI